MNVIGCDISFWQDRPDTARQVDFVQMAKVASFVIIRAGQGVWVDTDLVYNQREAKAAGMPRGFYWYYDNTTEPKAQARKFAEVLNGDYGELPLWADFENRAVGNYKGWRNWYTFLEHLKTLIGGHPIGIYTGPYYWKENTVMVGIPTASLNYFKQYPLWIANYGVLNPSIPAPWSIWEFWQYTDNGDGTLYGVESLNIDLNYFNGDILDFTQRYGGVVITPPTEDMTMAWKGTTLDSIPVRTAPDGGAISPYLAKNTPISGDAVDGTWLHMTAPRIGWVNAGAGMTKVKWETVTVTPPPPPPPPSTVLTPFTLSVDGHKPFSGNLEKL